MKVVDNKGVILITVMWVVLMLSLIAWGLSRRSAIEISLIETYQGKAIAQAAAWGAANVLLDSLAQSTVSKSGLSEAGFSVKDNKQISLKSFEHIDIGSHAYASVIRPTWGYARAPKKAVFGLEDAGGKININALNSTNYFLFSALMQIKGTEPQLANKIAVNTVDFIDDGEAVLNINGNSAAVLGEESIGQVRGKTAIKPKNKPLQDIHELLDVKGMTQEIFDKIKNDIVAFPATEMAINVTTASDAVIQAVGAYYKNLNTVFDAVSMVRLAKSIRDGIDGRPFTDDDGQVNESLDQGGNNLLRSFDSGYYIAHITGVDQASMAQYKMAIVLHKDTASGHVNIATWATE